jgi:transcriptional regulator with XRE-family HTH domain
MTTNNTAKTILPIHNRSKKLPITSKKNQEISKNIRLLRISQGLTQVDIAKRIGVTFQQIQKYESGMDSFSVDKLYEFSKIFKVNIETLLGKKDENSDGDLEKILDSIDGKNLKYIGQIARIFSKIKDDKIKEKIVDFAKVMV